MVFACLFQKKSPADFFLSIFIMNEHIYRVYPVVLFCYNRPAALQKTITHLQKNFLASVTDLYVFSDAAKTEKDTEAVAEVRSFLATLRGFNSVTIQYAEKNRGLSASVIGGVSKVLEQHEAVIVLEDDLVTSTNFLRYMNAALQFYRDHPDVMSISGYTTPLKMQEAYPYDVYVTGRASSWGWATWHNRWSTVDWEVKDYTQFSRDLQLQKQFNAMGSDLSGMLRKQQEGKINSWAIRWCYHQFRQNTFTVYPLLSKVQNIGFGGTATHMHVTQQGRFATTLDNTSKRNFHFPEAIEPVPFFTKQFISRYSLSTRIRYRLLKTLS